MTEPDYDDRRHRQETHSEKVRELLDDIPRRLTVAGWAVILLILAALILAAILLPWPQGHGESIFRHLI